MCFVKVRQEKFLSSLTHKTLLKSMEDSVIDWGIACKMCTKSKIK